MLTININQLHENIGRSLSFSTLTKVEQVAQDELEKHDLPDSSLDTVNIKLADMFHYDDIYVYDVLSILLCSKNSKFNEIAYRWVLHVVYEINVKLNYYHELPDFKSIVELDKIDFTILNVYFEHIKHQIYDNNVKQLNHDNTLPFTLDNEEVNSFDMFYLQRHLHVLSNAIKSKFHVELLHSSKYLLQFIFNQLRMLNQSVYSVNNPDGTFDFISVNAVKHVIRGFKDVLQSAVNTGDWEYE